MVQPLGEVRNRHVQDTTLPRAAFDYDHIKNERPGTVRQTPVQLMKSQKQINSDRAYSILTYGLWFDKSTITLRSLLALIQISVDNIIIGHVHAVHITVGRRYKLFPHNFHNAFYMSQFLYTHVGLRYNEFPPKPLMNLDVSNYIRPYNSEPRYNE